MKRLFQFYIYLVAWENYLLLARAFAAARLVRRCLDDKVPTPNLAPSVRAVDRVYLPPQPGWQISDPEKIVRFASFVVNVPTAWGKCVQRSLIAYRLLNGYGIPARVCFGVDRESSPVDGHAWIVRVSEPDRAFAEATDPRERFQLVYASLLPESLAGRTGS